MMMMMLLMLMLMLMINNNNNASRQGRHLTEDMDSRKAKLPPLGRTWSAQGL